MSLPLPETFNPALSADRLQQVAEWLLEELYATEDDLKRPTDTGYTRGCTAFGRQRSRIMTESALREKNPWLGLVSGDNAIVFSIGGVPCRFSSDDPSKPTKDAVLTANRYQVDFLEEATTDQPGRFCFIIARGHDESAEPRVEFLGFTPGGAVACRWVSSDTVRMLRRVDNDQSLPPTVPVAKPQIAPKRRDEGDAAAEAVR